MPDWFQPTVVLLPYAAWCFLGVGLPWTLVLLPRSDWRDRIGVVAVALALGPLGVTAVLFVLGTWGRITFESTLLGSGALAALGAAWAARRARVPLPESAVAPPTEAAKLPPAPLLTPAARGLIAGIALLLAVNVIIAAYWPFIAYDTQWVYGYTARVFLLKERIPSSIGYYPQLLPLMYTTMQQAWGVVHSPAMNDHAARVVIPWFNTAMVLMAFVLGRRLFGRARVGLLAAAAWMLYPHVAAWAGAGDLEIVLTLYVTGAAIFFVEAWRTGVTRYAVLSGVLLGGALWTKPTGGALALGIGLAVVGSAVAARGQWSEWKPRLRVASIVGIASVPLGGAWYVRNALLHHEVVTFPASYWHDFAQRSGQEFGWPLLIALLAAGGLVVAARDGMSRTRRGLLLLALILLLAGILPTALNPDRMTSGDSLWAWVRGDLGAARRLNVAEIAAIAAGFGLLARLGYATWRDWSARRRETLLLIWALLLPYAVVWFFDFSYHYRLSFAIVPLVGVQVAALIDGWLWDWLAARRLGRAVSALLIAGVVSVAAAASVQHTVQVWRDGGLPDDAAKYDQGNPSLMVVVHMLEDYAARLGHPPVVAIPAEDRLPFFFPTWDIRNSRDADALPVRMEDLAGVDVFVNTSPGVFLMGVYNLLPNALQADVAVAETYHRLRVIGWTGEPWPTPLDPIPLNPDGSLAADDGNFRYTAFAVQPEARYMPMQPAALRHDSVIIGDFAQFIGHDLNTLEFVPGNKITLTLYWRPTDSAPPPYDYSIFVHLVDPEGNRVAGWDGQPLQGQYPTRFWRPGESLLDYWVFFLPEGTPPGPVALRVGIYDPLSLERLPVTIDGLPAGDGVIIEDRITVPGE